jgi:hypothetical protein
MEISHAISHAKTQNYQKGNILTSSIMASAVSNKRKQNYLALSAATASMNEVL